MDIVDTNDAIKRCYKCDQDVLDNLNVVYNESNFMAVFWNKYQILEYENYDLQKAVNVFTPDFQIKHLMVTDNYITCLDCSGNLRVSSLKFKTTAKRLKSSFHPREQDVVACTLQDGQYAISLKYEYSSYFLNIHKVDSEFLLQKKVVLCNGLLPAPEDAKFILCSHQLTKEEFDNLKLVFNTNDYKTQSSLVIVSFDKLKVYGCLFGPRMTEDDVKLTLLYSCPAEICDIVINMQSNFNIVIGLKIGTIIQLPLRGNNKEPKIVHMNTAISKLLVNKDSIIYTDGISLWKAEKTFSECDITFNQYFVKHVKDFTKFGDRLLCTTFTKMLYVFPINDEKCFLKPESNNGYCSAEKLFDNSQYLHKIIEKVDKNNEIIKKINEEGNFITALSLSKRQDIMNDIIQCTAMVYDNYEDINDTNLILPDEIANYFDAESFLFLVTITTAQIQHVFKQTLSNIFKNIKIHITLSSEYKLLKTSSMNIKEEKKKLGILLPLKGSLFTDSVRLDIEIVTNIPGSLDVKEMIWVMLYRKTITLNSEHFIRDPTSNRKYLKTEESLNDLILKTALNQNGHLFNIYENTENCLKAEWSMYVKLPDNFKDILKSELYCKKHLNPKKASYIMQQYKSDEFLQAKCNISFTVGNERVILENIDDSFSTPLLKVTGVNVRIVFNIRNFFASIIYDDFAGRSNEFVNYTFYTTVADLQKAVKECITTSAPADHFETLFEQFERKIIGGLPL